MRSWVDARCPGWSDVLSGFQSPFQLPCSDALKTVRDLLHFVVEFHSLGSAMGPRIRQHRKRASERI